MENTSEKFSYFKTGIIGLGYFSINVTLCLYGPFLPLMLNRYTNSKFVIGLITTIGYLIGAVLQPYFGAKSDRTSSKFGKRKPYLLIGMPLSALFFVLIPYEGSFFSLLMFIIGFNIMLSVYRVPAMSIMADQTPKEYWNKANGIINFIGGIGALIAYFIGSLLFDMNKHYPFILVLCLLLISVIIINCLIDEKHVVKNVVETEKVSVVRAFIEIAKDKDKSAMLLLLSIFFRFMGYNGIEAFLTLYGTRYLKVSASSAAILLGLMALSFIIFAIPSGIIASKIGRKKAITLGIVFMTSVFLIDAITQKYLIIALLSPLGGFGYALININAYPMLLNMGGQKKVGMYTGLYYFSYSIATIIAPVLFGEILDVFGYGTMFFISATLLIITLLSFVFVKEES